MSFSSGFGKEPDQPVEYVFGRVDDVSVTVTKWDGGDQPAESYLVTLNRGGGQMACMCPAWKSKKTRPCKHYKMVEKWIDAGEPDQGEYACLGKGKDWVFEVNS